MDKHSYTFCSMKSISLVCVFGMGRLSDAVSVKQSTSSLSHAVDLWVGRCISTDAPTRLIYREMTPCFVFIDAVLIRNPVRTSSSPRENRLCTNGVVPFSIRPRRLLAKYTYRPVWHPAIVADCRGCRATRISAIFVNLRSLYLCVFHILRSTCNLSRNGRVTREIISCCSGISFVLIWSSKARASSMVRVETGSDTDSNDPRNSGCQTHNINTQSSVY